MSRTMDAYDSGYWHGERVASGRETMTPRRMSGVFWEGYGHGYGAYMHRQGLVWSDVEKTYVALATKAARQGSLRCDP